MSRSRVLVSRGEGVSDGGECQSAWLSMVTMGSPKSQMNSPNCKNTNTGISNQALLAFTAIHSHTLPQ